MRDRSETPPHAAPGPVRLSVPTFPTPAATRPRQASAPPDTPPDAPPDPPGPRVSAVQLRFRTDAIDDALAPHVAEPALGTDAPGGDARRPGDVWRIRWAAGQLAGYAICCPECGGVHCWTTARGCRVDVDASGDCEHRRAPTYGSCWTWAGAPEQGTLSASPPLDTRELEGRELDGPDPEGSEPGARCTFAGLLRCGWLVW